MLTLALSAGCSSPSQTPCNAGDKQCSGNGVQTCGSDHTWSSAVLCQNQACVNGACTGSCAPGAKECSGNGFHSCGTDGTWGAVTACTNQGCVEGACSGMCNPGDKQCTNNAAQTCGADGNWGTPSPCTMQACVQGACVGACEPSAKRCTGNNVETCGSDGTWDGGSPCTGMTCDQGACTGMCTVNDTRCHDGNVVQSCSDGGMWTDMATCPFVCTGGGQCTGVCVPGDKQCVDAGSQTCDGDGGWGALQNCVNEACVAGSCTGSCVLAALRDGGLDLANIPSTAFSLGGLTGTTCPNGSNPDAGPRICISEMNWGLASLDAGSANPTDLDITGTVAFRVEDIPLQFSCSTVNAAINGDGACPGGATTTWNVGMHLMFHPAFANSLTWNDTSSTAAQQNALLANMQFCGVPACDALCCIQNVCACALAGGNFSSVKPTIVNQVYQVAHTEFINRVQQQLCLTGASACPTGATVDANNVCMYATGACAPRPSLFGTCN
jgi:hypothetical protein